MGQGLDPEQLNDKVAELGFVLPSPGHRWEPRRNAASPIPMRLWEWPVMYGDMAAEVCVWDDTDKHGGGNRSAYIYSVSPDTKGNMIAQIMWSEDGGGVMGWRVVEIRIASWLLHRRSE